MDLLEVEYETEEKEELRHVMIDGKSGTKTITTYVLVPDGVKKCSQKPIPSNYNRFSTRTLYKLICFSSKLKKSYFHSKIDAY